MLPTVRQILVIRGGALGDGLLTLPALAALRTRWPQAGITLIGPRTLLPFASASRLADRILPIEDEAGLLLMRDSAVRPDWADVDLAVLWLQQRDEVTRQLESWGARNVIADASLPAADEPIHVADHLHRVLAPLSIGPGRLARPLPTPATGTRAVQDWWHSHFPEATVSVIAVHPGSGGQRKCWPASRFAALSRRLSAGGHRVILCLGPAEAEWATSQAHFSLECPGAITASNLELDTLAGVLQRCTAFIGNDAGVTHLAAALGVPTLAIFGPTDPGRWAPLGRQVRVVRDPAWAGQLPDAGPFDWTLSVQTVLAECSVFLAQASLDVADTEL